MIIEQDAQEAKNSFALSINSDLTDLRLGEASVWSMGPFREDMFKGTMTTEFKFRPGAAEVGVDHFLLSVEFRFRIIRDAKKNKAESGEAESGEIVKIACRFDGTYGVRKDFQPTEEQIQAFHRGNAIFNCWPYFREYVQSTVGRLNYPPLTVPFLRLMPKPPAANSISAIKEAKPPKKREAKRISAPKS